MSGKPKTRLVSHRSSVRSSLRPRPDACPFARWPRRSARPRGRGSRPARRGSRVSKGPAVTGRRLENPCAALRDRGVPVGLANGTAVVGSGVRCTPAGSRSRAHLRGHAVRAIAVRPGQLRRPGSPLPHSCSISPDRTASVTRSSAFRQPQRQPSGRWDISGNSAATSGSMASLPPPRRRPAGTRVRCGSVPPSPRRDLRRRHVGAHRFPRCWRATVGTTGTPSSRSSRFGIDGDPVPSGPRRPG